MKLLITYMYFSPHHYEFEIGLKIHINKKQISKDNSDFITLKDLEEFKKNYQKDLDNSRLSIQISDQKVKRFIEKNNKKVSKNPSKLFKELNQMISRNKRNNKVKNLTVQKVLKTVKNNV